MLVLGAILGFALLSWFLNHNQCEGLTWHGELGMPLMIRSDRLNCMRTGPTIEVHGIWRTGFELNEFYLTDSDWNIINPEESPQILHVPESTQFMIYEQLNIDPFEREPQIFKISFTANLMTNYLQSYSGYRNHYDVRKIESVSIFGEKLPVD